VAQAARSNSSKGLPRSPATPGVMYVTRKRGYGETTA
jgi:hypothetical protein